VTKQYQTKTTGVRDALELAVPERVSVVMADVAGDMSEGLLALAVGAGLQVMSALMEADVTALAGPRGRHDAERVTVRHGTGAGSVTLGGRRVGVQRPRVRAVDGSGELAVPAYELFSSTEILGRMAMERMLSGLSTRRYGVGLEPVGDRVTKAATATSRSAVSRRFVKMTETALADLLGADLSGLDLVALMVDGVHFAESCCVVALGIDIDACQAPVGAGGGVDREHDPGHRAVRRAARAGPGRHHADPRGAGRVQGAAPGRPGRVRPPGHGPVPAAQDPQRQRPSSPNGCGAPPNVGCGPPTGPTPRWTPRRSSTRWPGTWTKPTPAPRPACAWVSSSHLAPLSS